MHTPERVAWLRYCAEQLRVIEEDLRAEDTTLNKELAKFAGRKKLSDTAKRQQSFDLEYLREPLPPCGPVMRAVAREMARKRPEQTIISSARRVPENQKVVLERTRIYDWAKMRWGSKHRKGDVIFDDPDAEIQGGPE